MKRLILLLMTLCVLLCACGEKHDGVYTVEEMGENYKTQGRTIVYPKKGISLRSLWLWWKSSAESRRDITIPIFPWIPQVNRVILP